LAPRVFVVAVLPFAVDEVELAAVVVGLATVVVVRLARAVVVALSPAGGDLAPIAVVVVLPSLTSVGVGFLCVAITTTPMTTNTAKSRSSARRALRILGSL
jgi:hypothetical protein